MGQKLDIEMLGTNVFCLAYLLKATLGRIFRSIGDLSSIHILENLLIVALPSLRLKYELLLFNSNRLGV